MKRSFFATTLAVIMLLSLILSACSTPATPEVQQPADPGKEEPVVQEPEKPAEPVKVVFWRALTGAAGDIQDALVAEFNESQDEVEVEVQFQGTYGELLQKLQAAMIAGNVPDVVQLDSPFVILFAKNGALVPLDEFAADAENGVDLEDFIPGFMDGYYQEKLYALPYMRSTPLLYYNKEMFAEAGLPDRGPETWDEFVEFSEKLTKVDDSGTPTQFGASFTMGKTTAHWYLQGAIYGFGGLVSDEDFNFYLTQPEAMAAAKLWQDMVFEQKIAIPGIVEGDAQADFLNHRVGMVFGSTGSMSNLMSKADFTVGAGMIPGQVKREVPVGGSVVAMTSTDATRQAAAWKFMRFLAQPSSVAQIVIATGYLPTSKSAQEYPDLIEYYETYPERAIALEQLQYARPQASIVSLATGTEIMRQAVEKLLVGGMDVEQVMAEAEEALKTEYEENFK